MNMSQKRAALAAINPVVVADNNDPLIHRAITKVAESVGVVPSYAVGFFADIGASFKYEEAKRKGQLTVPVVEPVVKAKAKSSLL
jgi:hypothetical protein